MAAPPLRVVIVDDNETMRGVLRMILIEAEYQVVGEAGDGVQALEMVLNLQPDIVCLDVVMPGMDGLAVLKQIHDQFPKIIVLMVTSSTDRATVQAAVDRGAFGYIIKPFNSARVLDMLRAARVKFFPNTLKKPAAVPAPQ